MLTVDFIDEDNYTSEGEQQEISRLLNFAFEKLESASNAEISVSFVDSETIREINHQYRDKNAVTDVISFAMEDDELNLIHEDAPRTLLSTDFVLENLGNTRPKFFGRVTRFHFRNSLLPYRQSAI